MPTISESDLKKIISRGDFGTLYYLCGDEKLLVSHYTDLLIEKTAGKQPDDFNFHIFSDEFDVSDFEAASQMIPFMSDYNVVVVRDIDMTKFGANESAKILDTVGSVSGNTVIIFTFPTKEETGAKDSKAPNAKDTKLKAEIAKKGTVVEFKRLTPASLKTKLVSWASKRGVVISSPNAGLLVEYVGTDLNRLRSELEKLCAYAGQGGEITKESIDLLVTRDLESRIYDLSNAVIGHRASDAFRVLNTLLYNREDEMRIIAVLASAYVNIYRARIAVKSGMRVDELKKWFKYSDAQLKYAERDSRGTTTAALRKSINAIAETDMALKSTRTSKRLLLELLVEKLLIIANEGRRR